MKVDHIMEKYKKNMITVKRKMKAAVTVDRAVKAYDLDNMPLFEEIEIETLNRCNGKCSFCPVNVNEPQRPYHKMSRFWMRGSLISINMRGKNCRMPIFRCIPTGAC